MGNDKTADDKRTGGSAEKILTAVAIGMFLAAAVASVFILRPPKDHIVEIVQDDEVLYTIDLDSAEDMTFTVFYRPDGTDAARIVFDGNGDTAAGSSNTITIQGGEIWVSAAECPDHTCMKMGRLRSKSLPIVCLPNHLLIRFAER